MKQQQTVFVGLSGGVDSSVAAARLLSRGYNVVGVFIKVWQPDWLECNWEAERLDAMRVAAKLGIPFLTCDAEKAYEEDVARYFISEYKAGRTPNPDVMCNKHVKFGAFLQFATEHGADFVATGHYAQVKTTPRGHSLLRGIDTNKDQSYFLWTLTQAQLARTLLPVGSSTKDVIRKEAEALNLITASKKDSQGVCFLGHIDIPEFLSHYTTLVPGSVLNTHGEIVGTHKGALVYTIGQRHGFSVSVTSEQQKALYVVERDILANTLTVAPEPPITSSGSTIILSQTNYIAYLPAVGDTLHVQTRYRQTPHEATVTAIGDALCLTLTDKADAVSLGQSCVLYRGDECLGGGIIERCQS